MGGRKKAVPPPKDLPELERRFIHGTETDDEETDIQDFNDIITADEERVGEVLVQNFLGPLLDSKIFRHLTLAIITVNSIIIGLQTNENLSNSYGFLFSTIDRVVLTFFIVEICLKWYYGFAVFWKDWWNVLDFTIVMALLLGPSLPFLSSGRSLRLLRVIRAFRSLRSISSLVGLSLIVNTITRSIVDLINIVILLFILMVVLAVVGITLFSEFSPTYFRTLSETIFVLFICVTQDGWVKIFKQFEQEIKENGELWHIIIGAFFFIFAIIVGAFLCANLMGAVVVANLELALAELKEEERLSREKALLEDEGDNTSHDVPLEKEEILPAFHDVAASPETLLKQKPMELPTMKETNPDKVANYVMIVKALEKNYMELVRIQEEFVNIQKDLLATNKFDAVTEDDYGDADIVHQKSSSFTFDDKSIVRSIGLRGDILTNLHALNEIKQHNSNASFKGSKESQLTTGSTSQRPRRPMYSSMNYERRISRIVSGSVPQKTEEKISRTLLDISGSSHE